MCQLSEGCAGEPLYSQAQGLLIGQGKGQGEVGEGGPLREGAAGEE